MLIGEKLKSLRESKDLSQGDIEQRTGLLRCYTSRVENGHTVPSLETLEKYAHAIGVPLYKLFVDEEVNVKNGSGSVTAAHGKEGKLIANLQRHVKKMTTRDRTLLLHFASVLARRAA